MSKTDNTRTKQFSWASVYRIWNIDVNFYRQIVFWLFDQFGFYEINFLNSEFLDIFCYKDISHRIMMKNIERVFLCCSRKYTVKILKLKLNIRINHRLADWIADSKKNTSKFPLFACARVCNIFIFKWEVSVEKIQANVERKRNYNKNNKVK